MHKTRGNLILICLAVVIGGIAIYAVYTVNRSVQKTLTEERARLIGKSKIPFVKKVLTPLNTTHIRVLQGTRQTRDIADFDGSYFAATGGGLIRMSHEGKLEKHFTILDGLPESDLTCLAVFDNRLFIGTRTSGLLTFDGSKFESFEWTGRETNHVTTMFSDSGRLLIGTFGGGLIEFDGRDFIGIEFGTERASVNTIFRDADKLFIGTFDDGLYAVENSVESHFTTANGLPSNRVVGIVRSGGDVHVATDLGFGIIQPASFQTLAILPALADIALHDDLLFLTRDNGEIFTFKKALKKFSGETNMGNARFSRSGGKLWHLSNTGISEVSAGRLKEFGEKDDNGLTDNFVSALAFDNAANLWVGTFRNGIDVFTPDGRKRRHIESEQVREINFLHKDGETVSAATSAGIINFGSDLSPQSAIGTNGGLPSNSIMHLSPDAIATTSGLAFSEGNGFRILTTVNGLPNNSTYTTLRAGERLYYAGTLGGLAEIEGRRVVRTFTDINSNLTTNWVTALCLGGERLFIGTYGGGVFELMPSGEIRSFASETGKFAVNFNAMYTDGERLYIGTLDGVRVFDLRSQEWSRMKRELPSQTVMAINGDAAAVYFGTANGIARIEKEYFKTGEKR